ncbi:type 4a pilus biogenesis protein PilO [Patescibacteria group bacterium]
MTKNTYIFSGILGTAMILLVVFVIYPVFNGIEKDSRDFISLKRELNSLKMEIQKLEEVKKQNLDYQENLKKIDTLFIDSEIPVDFVRFLENLSLDSGISIDISFSSEPQGQNHPWPALLFYISAEGSFESFLRFLNKLENTPYLVEVQNLTVKRLTGEGVEASEDISANITLIVFSK